MMFQEITSRDIEIESPSAPDMFESSRIREIRIGGLEDLFLSFRKKHFETPLLFPFTFSDIMQIEHSSSRYQPPEFKTETVLTEEFYKRAKQMQFLIKISEMIDKIIYEEELFKGIDKTKLLKTISEVLTDVSFEWLEISDKELFERIKQVLSLEVMTGLLKELSSEQIEIFDEAVKRRSLFK